MATTLTCQDRWRSHASWFKNCIVLRFFFSVIPRCWDDCGISLRQKNKSVEITWSKTSSFMKASPYLSFFGQNLLWFLCALMLDLSALKLNLNGMSFVALAAHRLKKNFVAKLVGNMNRIELSVAILQARNNRFQGFQGFKLCWWHMTNCTTDD